MGWEPRQGSQHGGRPDRLKALTPTIGVVALSPMKRPNERRPGVTTYYRYDTSGNLETTTKTMIDTALHGTANELSLWLQCCHGQHSSTTSALAITWPQDHDEGHAQPNTRRWRSLQAKLARTSLKLSTIRLGNLLFVTSPGPELYIMAARAPISGDILILHPLSSHL
jgi:hypothetical protein